MSSGAPPRTGIWKFGVFELDESSGELRRGGSLIHLPPQPLQILKLLLANAGEIVDRDRICGEVWGDTAVDFDRSLNVAIAQIRSALNDNAASPRFVQTVPRRGYRFVADVASAGPALAAAPPRRWQPVAVAAGVLVMAALSVAAIRHWRTSPAPVRIAVLPFESISPDARDAARIDGLFDDLLTALGGTQPDRIEVVGRRSVSGVTARGPGSVRDLGRRLNANYILESTVRGEGGSLHLAARLVETAGETVRWSATFAPDGPPESFDQAVLGGISAGVLTTLFPGSSPAAAASVCREGREAFETGRMLANRGGLRDLERSLESFQQAGCPPAQAEAAEIRVRLARMGSPSGSSWESARAAALASLKGGTNLALAHLALGNISFWHDWNWTAAQREFREALRINPSDPDAHHDLAWLEVATGRRGDALASLETAIALDPLSARTHMDSAWLLLQIGRFDRAAAEARRALELDPAMKEARFCLSRALLYSGDVRAALNAVAPLLPAPVARQLAALSPADAVHRLVAFQAANAASDPYQRAWLLAWTGSRAQALGALEEAFARHNMMMPLIASDPAFRAIRTEPRFQAIVRRMALPAI